MKTQISLLILLFSLSISSKLLAQQPVFYPEAETFSVDYVKKHSQRFELINDKLVGAGAEHLLNAINKAQFTILGEYHGSAQLGKFTTTLLPYLKKANYHNFALEIGPYSAEKLSQLCDNKTPIVHQLNQLNTKFRVGPLDDLDTPIPFFHGIEDADFLQRACELDFNLWGIDQEYYSVGLLHADELLQLAKSKTNYQQILKDKAAFDSLFIACYVKDSEGEDDSFKMFEVLTNHQITKAFFAHFDATDQKAQGIIEALFKTWDIYNRYDIRGGKSHEHRISYMRQNLSQYYQNNPIKHPKVFIKIGGVHAEKFFEGRVYDVGNLAYDIAKHNQNTSVHILCLRRYFKQEEKIEDWYETYPNSYYRFFFGAGEKDQWTVIDLKPIQEQLASFQIHMPETIDFHDIKNLIRQYDYILIAPLDQRVQANYLETARISK